MTAMKTTIRILTLLIVAIATSCTAPKTVLKNKAVTDSTVTEHVREVRTSVMADTSEVESGEIVITEIFFDENRTPTDTAAPISLSLSLTDGKLSVNAPAGSSLRGIRQKILRDRTERKVSQHKETFNHDNSRKMTHKKNENRKERKPTTAPSIMNSLRALLAIVSAVALNVILFYGIRLYIRKRNEKQ